MTFAEANRESLYYTAEVTWGTTPGAAAMTEIRHTGETLNYDIQTIISDELRADRQVPETIQTSANVSGDVNYTLSYATFDDWLEAALAGDYTAAVEETGTNIAISGYDGGDQDSNYISIPGGVTPSDWPVGKIARISGFTTNGAEIFAPISLAETNKLYIAKNGPQLVDEGAGASITVDNDGMLRNGTTKKSFTLEKYMEDVTQYFAYTGCRIASMSMTFNAAQAVTGAFSWLGKAGARDTSSVGTSTVSANTNDIINATSDISLIREDEAATTETFETITINIDNTLRAQQGIGALGPQGIGYGRCLVTMEQTLYFQDGDLYDKFLANTAFAQSWLAQDSSGNSYYFTLPNCEIQTNNVTAGGVDTDIMAELTVACTRDADTDCQIQIDKFTAAS